MSVPHMISHVVLCFVYDTILLSTIFSLSKFYQEARKDRTRITTKEPIVHKSCTHLVSTENKVPKSSASMVVGKWHDLECLLATALL